MTKMLCGSAALALLALALPHAGPAAPTAAPRAQTSTWRDIVRIEQNHPFVVPEGHVLVLQSAAYGVRSGKSAVLTFVPVVRVMLNSESKLFVHPDQNLVPGFVVPADTRVEVEQDVEDAVGYVLGYLAPA